MSKRVYKKGKIAMSIIIYLFSLNIEFNYPQSRTLWNKVISNNTRDNQNNYSIFRGKNTIQCKKVSSLRDLLKKEGAEILVTSLFEISSCILQRKFQGMRIVVQIFVLAWIYLLFGRVRECPNIFFKYQIF